MELRKPTLDELRLIDFLASKASEFSISSGWKDKLRVLAMSDGGMGSLYIFSQESGADRVFGRQISECQFVDIDGTNVIASLNVDQNNQLFELEVWKTDFSKLIRIPDPIECSMIDE